MRRIFYSIMTSNNLATVYDEHYAKNADVDAQWTDLCSYMRLENTLNVINDKSYRNVLDVGAGDGAVAKRLAETENFASICGVEISGSAVQEINKLKLPKFREFKEFNGYEIPFDEAEFELAVCYHVLEHVEDPRRLLREIARVSAFQVFEVPLDYRPDVDNNISNYLAYGHISVFTPSTFRFLLLSEGFTILNDHYSDISWPTTKFMIETSTKPGNKNLRKLKARLAGIKRQIKRLALPGYLKRESTYSQYTCLTKFTGKPEIKYDQVSLW